MSGSKARPVGATCLVLAVLGAAALAGCGGRPVTPALEADLFVSDEPAASTDADAEQAIRPLLRDASAVGPFATLTVDYPLGGSIFPPEMVAPTFLWHDADNATSAWLIDVSFKTSPHHVYCLTRGARAPAEIDPRTVTETNVFHESAYQASAKAWTPGERVWTLIKRYSAESDAQVTISGIAPGASSGVRRVASRGSVVLSTSTDPVGALIFYRDVPLMPSETKDGIVKPLKSEALPLIKWRLREISKPAAPVVMEYLPTCANCHSFSRDGRTLSMDIDGPDGDKGAHVVKAVERRMVVEKRDVFTWNSFRGPEGEVSFGMFPQASPDGRHVIATVHESVYVQNYMDYGFLQTFYPTRGILAFYTKATGEIRPLPGADDPRYVQTNAVWSFDGKTLVFLRAEARNSYGGGAPAEFANDPRETQIRFDLYRIPFNEGQGGAPEPVPGASDNGFSNSFPKFSPDGKWIVFVQCKNGLLMRPDGKLYIMPAEGGAPRLMKCNTSRMNSWHSWSPNSRWLVFSSKCNTPYTQMFLTHVDEDGNDSPAILVPNSTAANRAVNLPEFANLPPGSIEEITTPAVDYRRHMEKGKQLIEKGQLADALAELQKSLDLKSDYPDTLVVYGYVLAEQGRTDEAMKYYSRAIDIEPRYYPAYVNFGVALSRQGKLNEAIGYFSRALDLYPNCDAAHYNWGNALRRQGKLDEALAHYRKTVEITAKHAEAHNNIGAILNMRGQYAEAVEHFRKALEADPAYGSAQFNWATALVEMGSIAEAVEHYRKSIEINPKHAPSLNALARILATHSDAGLRDGREAVRLAEAACALAAEANPAYLDTLACACAEAGRFDDAVRAAGKALELARSAGNDKLAAEIQSRLDLFKNKRPFRR